MGLWHSWMDGDEKRGLFLGSGRIQSGAERRIPRGFALAPAILGVRWRPPLWIASHQADIYTQAGNAQHEVIKHLP